MDTGMNALTNKLFMYYLFYFWSKHDVAVT